VLVETARAAEGRAVAEACLAAHPNDPLAAACLANLLNYAPGVPRAEVAAAHRRFGELLERANPAMPPGPWDRDPDRPLRVAFVSADFREHSVAYFIEPVLKHLPRGGLHVTAVSRVLRPDAMTARLRTLADGWVDASAMNDRELAEAVRARKIDVCVELSGLTQGNALAAFCQRPAPVQVSYLGYPNTCGLAAVTGRIADAVTDPPGEPPLRQGEQTLRLDPVFLCYRPGPLIHGEPFEPEAPRRVEGPPTFASFNVVSKLNEPLADAWAAVLRAAPASRLLLKARSLGGPALKARIAGWFTARGVEAGRVELLDHAASHADHMALYRRVDVALDPFPYNGTTTTCEALSMGVPVVTLRGSAHAGRVGASILTSLGEPSLIADGVDAYIRLATGLMADRDRLAHFRATLRGRLLASPLGDGPGMGQRMAAALREAWRAWCLGGT
jgi:predicted O-linked N-acetylglucosamine transferase (SPINDLY family)